MTTGPQQYYSQVNPGMTPGPQVPTKVPRRRRLVIAAVLAGLAAALTVASMFLPYNSYVVLDNGEVEFGQESGPWGAGYTLADGQETPDGTVPLYGIALTLLLAALLAGAVLAGVASSRYAAAARLRTARAVAIGYGTAAASIETMLSIATMSFLSYEDSPGQDQSFVSRYSLEIGYWLLLGMAVLAVVAMVLTLVPDSSDHGGAPFDPRYGVPQQYPYYGRPGYAAQQTPQPGAGPWAR